jgi:LysM repeat protein
MQSSCAQWSVPDNTDDEINDMYNSIQSVASSTGIDARFIFAIIMQESNGCVRAPTTNYGVRNPGLMQSHNGAGTCNDGSVQNPCPSSEITQMIQDGSAGTSSGDGLKQCLAEAGTSDVSMYYKAARIYNSGSIAGSGNLGAGIATACYATDIANRLTGWFSGPSGCDPGTIADLAGTATAVSTQSTDESPATTTTSEPSVETTGPALVASIASSHPTYAPTPTTSSVASQTTVASSIATTAPTPTTSTTATSTAVVSTTSITIPVESSSAKTATGYSSAQVYPGATSTCQQLYTVQPGDYCIIVEQKFGISMAQLMSWNSGLDIDCSNLWLAYQYCVKA